jgi:hypothetical protein
MIPIHPITTQLSQAVRRHGRFISLIMLRIRDLKRHGQLQLISHFAFQKNSKLIHTYKGFITIDLWRNHIPLKKGIATHT